MERACIWSTTVLNQLQSFYGHSGSFFILNFQHMALMIKVFLVFFDYLYTYFR